MAQLHPALGVGPHLLQGFLLILLQQRVYADRQPGIDGLQTLLAMADDGVHLPLTPHHLTQTGLQGIHGIICLLQRVHDVFHRRLHLDGRIRLGGRESLAKPLEKALFRSGLRGRHHRIPMMYQPPLHAGLHRHGVRRREDILYFGGGNQAVVHLSQGAQDADGVVVFLLQQCGQAVHPLLVMPVGLHKDAHLPMHEVEGEKQHRQQRRITDDDLESGYIIHNPLLV